MTDFIDQTTEYLDEEFEDDPENSNYAQLLPTIQKSLASKTGYQLDNDTKYKFTRKPGKIVEVQCTTSSGAVVLVELEDTVPVSRIPFTFTSNSPKTQLIHFHKNSTGRRQG